MTFSYCLKPEANRFAAVNLSSLSTLALALIDLHVPMGRGWSGWKLVQC